MTVGSRAWSDLHPSLVRALNRLSRSGLEPQVVSRVMSGGMDGDRFCPAWEAEGKHWEDLAAGAAAGGNAASARGWYRQAFYCYRLAEFARTENLPEKLRAYDASLRCFDGAVRGERWPPQKIRVHADGTEFRGFMVTPDSASPVPMVMAIYGADGNKEEHYWSTALPLVERGLGVLIADGPGQGWSLRHGGVGARPDFEVFASACVDALEAADRAVVDRLGLMGSSMGGYYAPRAFVADERFRVLLVNSALFDVVSGLWDVYEPIRPQLAYNIRARTLDEARAAYAPFNLGGIVNRDPARRACIFHGKSDSLMPFTEAEKVARLLGERTELVLWDGAGHNLGNVATEARPRMYDWLAARLHG